MPTRTSYTETVYVDGVGDVPRHLAEGLLAHALTGFPVGGFLTALLCNDLVRAIGNADDTSMGALKVLAAVVYNCLPRDSWGSVVAVDAWKEAGGFEGTHTDRALTSELNALRLACEKVTL